MVYMELHGTESIIIMDDEMNPVMLASEHDQTAAWSAYYEIGRWQKEAVGNKVGVTAEFDSCGLKTDCFSHSRCRPASRLGWLNGRMAGIGWLDPGPKYGKGSLFTTSTIHSSNAPSCREGRAVSMLTPYSTTYLYRYRVHQCMILSIVLAVVATLGSDHTLSTVVRLSLLVPSRFQESSLLIQLSDTARPVAGVLSGQ